MPLTRRRVLRPSRVLRVAYAFLRRRRAGRRPPGMADPSHSAVLDRAGFLMLYERLLDLAPGARLERRLAERVAARLVIGVLLTLPLCAVAAFVLAAGAVHAASAAIWDAGRVAGLRLRDGLEAVLAPRITPR